MEPVAIFGTWGETTRKTPHRIHDYHLGEIFSALLCGSDMGNIKKSDVGVISIFTYFYGYRREYTIFL
ncbi:hypothetical protein Pcar_3328 [Syntrophotalea carbinolica DSM 2380]|uniref:Uncharacterized protein n=1 Tax=Syntrophotalea carbinolica (strain DSM 2380 / NBRC 103641 / GraBd1) TaxID=338963 RepID=Q0C6J4_SYNC1|nr:hypothetical protein Pcar_3328 [Syntrophotalea carbinolica DSM 2380]